MQKQDADGGITASEHSPWWEKQKYIRSSKVVLLSEHSSNTQHCIMPVCILFTQIQRRDAESESEKNPGTSVKIIPKGKPPSLIQDQRQWGFSYPQWKERQKEGKMVPLFPTSKTRVSAPITRLATSYLQKHSWLIGSIYWKSFLFYHLTEMVGKKRDIHIMHNEQVPACPQCHPHLEELPW